MIQAFIGAKTVKTYDSRTLSDVVTYTCELCKEELPDQVHSFKGSGSERTVFSEALRQPTGDYWTVHTPISKHDYSNGLEETYHFCKKCITKWNGKHIDKF